MKTRARPPSPEYLKFLSPFDDRIRELALATRAFVLDAAPDSTELIYDAYNAVATGFSFTGRPSDAFIHVAVYARWVNLGFNRGAQLDDPAGVLQGTGRWIRHIRIPDLAALEKPGLRALVRAAIDGADRPDAQTAKPESKSVVRAIYPKRRRPVRT